MRSAALLALAVGLGMGGCSSASSPIALTGPSSIAFDASLPGPALTADYEPAAPAAVIAPSPPEPVDLPVLTPCAPGWIEVAGDPSTCAPWPAEAEATACAVDEALLPGTSGCEPIGAGCPVGEFPTGLPATGVRYVDDEADPGGDGSVSAPFQTIGDALVDALPGTVVAIAKGTYGEVLAPPAGVTLWGACARETIIDGTLAAEPGVPVTVLTPDVILRDVSLGSTRTGLLIDGDAGSASSGVSGVVVRAAVGVGVLVAGDAVFEAEGLLVRDVAPDAGGDGGRALSAWGGTVSLSRVALEGSSDIGLFVRGDAVVNLEDSVIRDTRVRARDGRIGVGLWVQDGANASVERTAIVDAHTSAVFARDTARVTLLDSWVARGAESLANPSGVGLWLQGQAEAVVTRVVFEDLVSIGAYMTAGTPRMQLTDTIIRRVSPDSGGALGRGISLFGEVGLDLERVLVEDVNDIGVAVSDEATLSHLTVRRVAPELRNQLFGMGIQGSPGSNITGDHILVRDAHLHAAVFAGTAVLTDVTAQDTRNPPALDVPGVGLSIGDRASLTRVLVEGGDNVGIQVSGEGAELHLTDASVRGIRPTPLASTSGVFAGLGGSLFITRVSLEDNGAAGLTVSGGVATGSDLRVIDNDGDPALLGTEATQTEGGFGLQCIGGAIVDLIGVELERNRTSAVVASNLDLTLALDAQTEVVLRDVVARGTRPSSNGLFGRAIQVHEGATARVERARFEDNQEISAIAFGAESFLRLEETVILGTRARAAPYEATGGIGAGAYLGARIELDRFRVEGSALVGLQLAREGTGALRFGVVARQPLGVNLQTPGIPIEDLIEDVLFLENGRNLDAAELPIPLGMLDRDADTP